MAGFRGLRTPDVTAGGVNLVIAFGARAWREVAGNDAPADLEPFRPIAGLDGHGVPATQPDAWLWISGAEPDVTWQSARAADRAVAAVAELVAEQPAFTYRGGRDITGFVDGTANPPVRRAPEVALLPPGRPRQAGSHVLTMRWVHDLAAFERLAVEDQERVFGRTKGDSVELPPGRKPPNAHIARVETSVDGAEVEIFRRGVPFGTAEDHGLCFVAFSAERARYDLLLARMFGNAGGGVRDRLTDFSRPTAAAYLLRPIADHAERARRIGAVTAARRRG